MPAFLLDPGPRRFARGVLLAWGVALAAAGCGPVVVGDRAVGAPSNIDERPVTEQVADQAIERTIERRLRERFGNDGRMRWNVASFDGYAVLVGRAPDEATRTEMEDIASATQGLGRLDNEVVVGPAGPPEARATDLAVAANLRRRLMNDAGARFTSLKVLVDDGVAHLVGRVTRQQEQVAEFIARDTRGVREVVTHWAAQP